MERQNTASDWAARITKSYLQSHASIIEAGMQLGAAKKALPHGEWLRMFPSHPNAVEHPLPFEQRTAQRLMKLAKHSVLSDPAHAPLLPFRWFTLYELSKIPSAGLLMHLDNGDIWPGMERADAKMLVNAHNEKRPGEHGTRRAEIIHPKFLSAVRARNPMKWSPERAHQRLRRVVEAELQAGTEAVGPERAEAIILGIIRLIVEEVEDRPNQPWKRVRCAQQKTSYVHPWAREFHAPTMLPPAPEEGPVSSQ